SNSGYRDRDHRRSRRDGGGETGGNLERCSTSLCIDVAAAPAIAFVDGSPDRSRNIARAGRCLRVVELLPRFLGLRETAGLQPLQLLRHRRLEEGREIAVRNRGPHQGLETVELLDQLGTGRELDLVAGGSKGLDVRGERRSSRCGKRGCRR